MLDKFKKMRKAIGAGYALVEILAVVVTTGVLSAVALPILLKQQKTAAISSIKSDVMNAVAAVKMLLVNNPTATALEIAAVVTALPTSGGNTLYSHNDWLDYQIGGYRTNMPPPEYLEGYYRFDSADGKFFNALE